VTWQHCNPMSLGMQAPPAQQAWSQAQAPVGPTQTQVPPSHSPQQLEVPSEPNWQAGAGWAATGRPAIDGPQLGPVAKLDDAGSADQIVAALGLTRAHATGVSAGTAGGFVDAVGVAAVESVLHGPPGPLWQ
jgi:hypothetical protein